MTPTERVRELLDERGVEYEVDDAKTVRVTRWGAYGDWVSFIEYDNGDTKFCIDARRLTPEQAIAATLGAGTCHDEGDPSDFCCSECGVRMFTETSDTYTMIASDERTIIKHPNYCPNCGRRVEVDE